MNPELNNDKDWLDEALRARRVMTPSRGFTDGVLARHKAQVPVPRAAEWLAEHGMGAGMGLVATGIWAGVDLNRPAAILATALGAPEAATAITVLTICLGWLATRKEPEGDAS